MTPSETTALADALRTYVIEFGAKAACAVIVAVLEEQVVATKGTPASTIASIDADVLKHAMGKMVG
jgi:hypothetical protein